MRGTNLDCSGKEKYMVLLLDLGNTNLYVGVYQNGTLVNEYRTNSDVNRSSDEYMYLIKTFLMQNNLDIHGFKGAILSSVIPSLTHVLTRMVKKLLKVECMIIGKSLKSGLSIRIDNPNELGTDLVADSVGAKFKYGYPLLITDMGTATKILVIDKDGNFVGCAIAPGIMVSMIALTKKSAQLMDVDLLAPKKVIGKNSPDSLNSGSIYGNIAMIEGMCKKMEEELGYPCKKVLTGGYSNLLNDYISEEFIHDPTLIFEGLYQIYLKNGGEI